MATAGETIEFGSWQIPWGMAEIKFESRFVRNFLLHVPIYGMGFYCFTTRAPAHVVFLKGRIK